MDSISSVNAIDVDVLEFERLADEFNSILTLDVKMEILAEMERQEKRKHGKRPASTSKTLMPPPRNEKYVVSPATKRRNMMLKNVHVLERRPTAPKFSPIINGDDISKNSDFEPFQETMYNDAGEFVGIPYYQRFNHDDPLGLQTTYDPKANNRPKAIESFPEKLHAIKSYQDMILEHPVVSTVVSELDHEIMHEMMELNDAGDKNKNSKWPDLPTTSSSSVMFKYMEEVAKLPFVFGLPYQLPPITAEEFEIEMMEFRQTVAKHRKEESKLEDKAESSVSKQEFLMSELNNEMNSKLSEPKVPIESSVIVTIKEILNKNKSKKKDSKLPIAKRTPIIWNDDKKKFLSKMKPPLMSKKSVETSSGSESLSASAGDHFGYVRGGPKQRTAHRGAAVVEKASSSLESLKRSFLLQEKPPKMSNAKRARKDVVAKVIKVERPPLTLKLGRVDGKLWGCKLGK